MIEQNLLMYEFNKNNFKTNTAYINDFEYELPNISVTTVPLKTIRAKYLIRDGKYTEALELLHDAKKYNPFLMVTQNAIAELHEILVNKDSIAYYAEYCFNMQPNHIYHLARYIKLKNSQNDLNSLDEAWEKYIYKSKDSWAIYLALIVNIPSESRTQKMIKNLEFVKKNISLPPFNDNEIKILLDYIDYGLENVNEAVKYFDQSKELFDSNNFQESKEKLLIALKFRPNNVEYIYALGLIEYKLNNFAECVRLLEEVEEIERIYKKGQLYFIKGLSKIKLNRKAQGCEDLTEALLNNYNDAYQAKRQYCN